MPEIQKWAAGEPYVHPHGRLLEGPFFEEYANRLRFVDIKGKKLFTLDLATGPSSLQEHTLDTPISITADIEGVDPNDRILIGAKYGLAVLNRRTWAYQYVKRYYEGERAERMRSNDLNVDGEGRVWVGTMNDFPVGDPQEEGRSCDI
jgi:sugar lactone lactonase YvrE